MVEEFTSIKPKTSLLSHVIDYYYFHNVTNDDKEYTVIYYPHYNTVINFYKNAEVRWNDEGRTIKSVNTKCIKCFYTSNHNVSRSVTLIGSNYKIGIVFKPLGLNHFIDCNLNKISKDVITPFQYFGASFTELGNKLYDETDIDKKCALLDAYFTDRYIGFKDRDFEKLIKKMVYDKSDFLVNDAAQKLEINRKTLLRKFQRHLLTTPSKFKVLLKFRNALHQYDSRSKLTHIAYDSNYYDQSTFIKNYKTLVGLSPKKLFSTITNIGKNSTLWTKLD
ncbi:helix-turn-helix domain-containing protein [Spongiimicrobium sp. 3-5]|uniref:helix-turn-helix domain-containing protein n=1 Tax=Spongiimicrobium sp. 3-5 TaxID=3332596 RepID=UPI0039803EB2